MPRKVTKTRFLGSFQQSMLNKKYVSHEKRTLVLSLIEINFKLANRHLNAAKSDENAFFRVFSAKYAE